VKLSGLSLLIIDYALNIGSGAVAERGAKVKQDLANLEQELTTLRAKIKAMKGR
jgi:hypothetical protein